MRFIPALTAGGINDAAIATPTRLPKSPLVAARATPAPEAAATTIPRRSNQSEARAAISGVGQGQGQAGLKLRNIRIAPIITPIMNAIASPNASFLIPVSTRRRSLIIAPKLSPRMGPISGARSILATMNTGLLVASPMAAMIQDTTRRARKSNDRRVPDAILL